MKFESGHIYHIYNQGNNRQRIFFDRDNYLFFIEKIRTFMLPYADILAWCLMPNHFHFMVYVKHTSLATAPPPTVGVTAPKASARRVTPTVPTGSCRTFNDSIGIMLRSYTRAINIREDRSGSLFREETKAICLTQPLTNPPVWYNFKGAARIWTSITELEYPGICYNYILTNPVRAGLVSEPSQWEFSSYNELLGKEILISKKRVEEFELKLLPDRISW